MNEDEKDSIMEDSKDEKPKNEPTSKDFIAGKVILLVEGRIHM